MNHLIKLSNRSYYNNFFSIHVNNGKRIWQGIKQIVQINPQVNQSISKIVLENCEITDPKAKANAFNNYFANIGGNLASSIPGASKTVNEFMAPPMCDSLFLCPVTEDEIQLEIAKPQTGKAVGPSSIPISILKILKSELAGPLQVIFNTSFLTGIVPDKFKLAKLIPVFKKGSQTNLSNYRPISLLIVFNKLLEKLMFNRLADFLEKRHLIYNKQFGFRLHHSTDHAVLSIIDQVQKAIEDRDYPCGIFLDFRRAFDTVNHNILLSKLEFYGIRGVVKDLSTSYLRNRMQMMSLASVNSDIQPVYCGVPPGSVLGPLLFLIYINDFHNCSELLDSHLFADDANLFFKHKGINILENEINSELANVHIWLSANKLSLNIEKSNLSFFIQSKNEFPRRLYYL